MEFYRRSARTAVEELAWLAEEIARMRRIVERRQAELRRFIERVRPPLRDCGLVSGEELRRAANAVQAGSRVWWSAEHHSRGDLERALRERAAAEDGHIVN